jgi:hypothetical protein
VLLEEPYPLVPIHAGRRHLHALLEERLQFRDELVVIPLRLLAGPVIGDPICLHLGRREIGGDVHGHAPESHLDGSQVAGIADDDREVGVDHDRLTPAELAERGDHLGHRAVVLARVIPVALDHADRHGPHLEHAGERIAGHR